MTGSFFDDEDACEDVLEADCDDDVDELPVDSDVALVELADDDAGSLSSPILGSQDRGFHNYPSDAL